MNSGFYFIHDKTSATAEIVWITRWPHYPRTIQEARSQSLFTQCTLKNIKDGIQLNKFETDS